MFQCLPWNRIHRAHEQWKGRLTVSQLPRQLFLQLLGLLSQHHLPKNNKAVEQTAAPAHARHTPCTALYFFIAKRTKPFLPDGVSGIHTSSSNLTVPNWLGVFTPLAAPASDCSTCNRVPVTSKRTPQFAQQVITSLMNLHNTINALCDQHNIMHKQAYVSSRSSSTVRRKALRAWTPDMLQQRYQSLKITLNTAF